MIAKSGFMAVVGILCHWGYRVCGLCFDQERVGIVFPQGFVRWVAERELRHSLASRRVAQEIAETVPYRAVAARGEEKNQQTVVDISPRELAWWVFLRTLYERGELRS